MRSAPSVAVQAIAYLALTPSLAAVLPEQSERGLNAFQQILLFARSWINTNQAGSVGKQRSRCQVATAKGGRVPVLCIATPYEATPAPQTRRRSSFTSMR